ncbi:N-terminal domain of NEFA-interacting nuclear protein NIP30-domain-containing protein [Pseudomassariella vexata]|uniref:N-terminal domain of NEFA-interacting nuclear protein NIP30-domain-containing protein n=1 Tax=Pseudomassariella vexata TaxID=1141098 RepID=A0A1Y2DBG0_9PEZI|nr:N-terminal domain of NEFA-interacting nuclear protein NIP30-domain-containing protein [Pseudomassariella vexata]ORY56602.1 N-terminal domain of NEFA-interacting nuclear protein NIP30-domain-containing protein [Pseudomassariella vexata]
MSSRFVSGGIIPGDGTSPAPPPPAGTAATASAITPGAAAPSSTVKSTSSTLSTATPTTTTTSAPQPNPTTASAWSEVESRLQSERLAREAARKSLVEGTNSQNSLYDVLQANKAAKQAAFEEASRLRNQFRALDDDEIDFLDEVEEEKRKEEERIRRETEERLRRFKEAQRGLNEGEEGEVGAGIGENEVGLEWSKGAAGRKRKREKDEKIKGLKRRVSSGVKVEAKEEGISGEGRGEKGVRKVEANASEALTETNALTKATPAPAPSPTVAKPKLGLMDYGSDDDD